jgi:hypothetical protein
MRIGRLLARIATSPLFAHAMPQHAMSALDSDVVLQNSHCYCVIHHVFSMVLMICIGEFLFGEENRTRRQDIPSIKSCSQRRRRK